jgi:hypothetical protein
MNATPGGGSGGSGGGGGVCVWTRALRGGVGPVVSSLDACLSLRFWAVPCVRCLDGINSLSEKIQRSRCSCSVLHIIVKPL